MRARRSGESDGRPRLPSVPRGRDLDRDLDLDLDRAFRAPLLLLPLPFLLRGGDLSARRRGGDCDRDRDLRLDSLPPLPSLLCLSSPCARARAWCGDLERERERDLRSRWSRSSRSSRLLAPCRPRSPCSRDGGDGEWRARFRAPSSSSRSSSRSSVRPFV